MQMLFQFVRTLAKIHSHLKTGYGAFSGEWVSFRHLLYCTQYKSTGYLCTYVCMETDHNTGSYYYYYF